jgi:hypothetical protein
MAHLSDCFVPYWLVVPTGYRILARPTQAKTRRFEATPVTLKFQLTKVARITAKIVLGLVAFVLLFALACFILNSFDAPLSDQAKALLAAPPNPYPSDGNIYLAMAGFEGPGDRSIIDMGQERIDAYNKALDSVGLNPDTVFSLDNHWGASKLKIRGKLELGSPRSTSIWASTKSHRQEIAAILADNQQLYQRYLFLHHLPGYYETARPSYMAPLVFLTPQIRTVFLSDVANRMQTGTPTQQREALADLQRDLQMWRTVLKGDGALISKMLSVAFLHGDMILLADLITDPSFDSSLLEEPLDSMLLRVDPNDYRIGNAFAAEFRGTTAFYKTITAANELSGSMASSSWLNRVSNAFQAHFFKLNATENMGAALAAQSIALGNSEPSQFYLNREGYREWLKLNEPHLSPAYLYNPMGKVFAALAVSQNDGYILRAFDVAAYQRLVYLVFQLKRQHIATGNVATFMAAHPDWSIQPVDGKPFQWNPETGELAVNTLGEHPKDQRFSVTLR